MTINDYEINERSSDRQLDDLARMLNPIIRGWIIYYSRFYQSALYLTLRYLDWCLARWANEQSYL